MFELPNTKRVVRKPGNKLFKIIILVCGVCEDMHMCRHMHHCTPVEGKSVLSSHFPVGSLHRTQVTTLAQQVRLTTEPSSLHPKN